MATYSTITTIKNGSNVYRSIRVYVKLAMAIEKDIASAPRYELPNWIRLLRATKSIFYFGAILQIFCPNVRN